VARGAIALHSTDYWTPYLSAWARIGDFEAEQVFKSMNTSGKYLLRRPAFRNAHHVIHIDMFPLILSALGPHLARSMRPAPPIKGLSDAELEERIDEIIGVLSDGPASMNDLKKKLPHIGDQMRWILLMANGRGLVIRTRSTHARNNRLDYDLLSRWIDGASIPKMEEEQARRELTLRYISTFGPVSLDDFSWWLPAKKTEAKKLFGNLTEDINMVEADGKPCYMTKDDLEISSSLEPPSEPIVFFLPYEDHFPKAYKDRQWYLSEDMENILFPRNREHYWPPKMEPPPPGPPKGMNASGEKRPSIWVNGRIVGRWEIDQEKDDVTVSIGLIEKVDSKVKPLIEEKRQSLQEFIQKRLIPISK
ncbi:MAG: winged helix DNA-binding domain-containing protein, partial [Candidatus Thorarchaeota archaeon]|nr:winged helix DNA-binding domain-containing protein [Candidatus Thorarchaeota archaeon]